MSRVGRLAGAILVETGGVYYLVGNPKVPCDWRAAGFEPPGEIDALKRPFIALSRLADAPAPALGVPELHLDIAGDALPRVIADRLVIARTGSISERLWRLVIGDTDELSDAELPDVIAARWLGEVPPAIWNIVRDTVLRCS